MKLEQHQLKSRVAPIYHLVDDVLLEIFVHVVRTTAILPTRSPHQHPAKTLSHVSRRWRSIALSSPHLWTKLYIACPAFEYLKPSPQFFLSCSRSLPLDVLICRTDFDVTHSDDVARVSTIVRALLPSVNRWKKVEVYLSAFEDDAYLVPLLQCDPASYSQLEILKIDVMSDKVNEFAILCSPALKSLKLKTWKATWAVPSSWSQLGVLEVRAGVDQGVVAAVMSNCPSLSKLTIKVEEDASILEFPAPIEELVHHSLTFLSIRYKESSDLSLFFVPQTPALQTFHLSYDLWSELDEDDISSVQSSILRVVRSCALCLVDLKLHDCLFEEAAVIDLLVLLPNLKRLDIAAVGSALTVQLFKSLVRLPDHAQGRMSGSAICPNLQSLQLQVQDDALSDADQRIDVTFSLLSALITRGIQTVSINSDAWRVVHPRDENGNLKSHIQIPDGAREEASFRALKLEEVSRRIAEMNKVQGMGRLKLLSDHRPGRWDREDLVGDDGTPRYDVYLIGRCIVYEAS